LVVSKGAQTITFNPPVSQTFVPNGNFALSATAPGGAVAFTSSNTNVISVSGSTVTMRGAGTAVITANQGGNANYAAAPVVTRSVTVNKGSQTIRFNQPAVQTFVPNGTFALTATAPGGAVAFTSSNTNVISIVGATATMRGAGTAVITANQAGNANYAAATAVTRSVTVNKGSQTITFNPPAAQTFVPNGTFALSATAPGGAVAFTSSNTNVISVSGSTATMRGAGTAVITANQGGNANYAAATAVTRSVTVNKGSQTITFTQPATQSFVPNGTFALSATAPGGAVAFTSSNTNVMVLRCFQWVSLVRRWDDTRKAISRVAWFGDELGGKGMRI
jgi:precorrin-4 methylase